MGDSWTVFFLIAAIFGGVFVLLPPTIGWLMYRQDARGEERRR